MDFDSQPDQQNDAANQPDEGDAAAENLWDEFEAAEADNAKPETDEPPPQSAGDEAEDNGTDRDQAHQPAGEQPTGQDLWANAPAELRAEFEKVKRTAEENEHRYRSQTGRLMAVERRMQELQSSPSASAPTAEDRQKAADYFGSEKWQNFAKDFPEIADPLKGAIDHLGIDRLQQEVRSVTQVFEQDAMAAEEERLNAQHADWRDVIGQNADTFRSWLDTQPRHIREAALRNANQINDAEEAADVVARFKQHIGASPGATRPSGGSSPRLSGRRQAQLESGSAPTTRARPAASSIPEEGDPEAIWREFDRLEQRQAGRR